MQEFIGRGNRSANPPHHHYHNHKKKKKMQNIHIQIMSLKFSFENILCILVEFFLEMNNSCPFCGLSESEE